MADASSLPLSDAPSKAPRVLGQAQASLAAHRLYAMLSAPRRRATLDLVDLILRFRRGLRPGDTIIETVCARLIGMGVPVDRYGSSTSVLTPEHDAIGRIWTREEGVQVNHYVRPAGEDPNYLNSPFFEAATTQEWVELWLPETPDDRFDIVPVLKAGGYVHYLCIPFQLSNDANAWITLATRSASGFSPEDLAVVALVVPAISRLIDARVGWSTLERLLRTYVGDEPHRSILAGNVKRGRVTTIRSAIFFADMRDSTGHTAEISAVQAVELFNSVFDVIVPAIEDRQGEVLKYLGDGLLAIFREGDVDGRDPTGDALAAAEAALDALLVFNEARTGVRPVEIGIALHFGEAAYGNIGSGQRLDFTVIGRDIGLASRIGAMNGRLGEPLLLSEAFVSRLRRPVVPLGAFAARGFSEPLSVFRPTDRSRDHA